MSLVYITYHNENIYDVEKEDVTVLAKPEKYVSKFKKSVREDFRKVNTITLEDGKKLLTSGTKCSHKTMGFAETPLDPPCAYLKKNQGIKWQRQREHVCPKSAKMPPIPKYEPQPKEVKVKDSDKKMQPFNPNCPHPRFFRGHKHRANFVKVNIELMKKSQAKRPPPRYVDTPNGSRHPLLNTGLIPQYICSRNFGKVPCYLEVHKKMLSEARERCEAQKRAEEEMCMKHLGHGPGMRQLLQEEKDNIVKGLKMNFAESMKAYQGLSVTTDTIAKKLRKAHLEHSLRQLEQDIHLMESNQDIYISEY